MLDVKVESYRYPGSSNNSLEGISIKLPCSEIYRLIGDNGSGKTTFSLLISGIIPNIIKGKLNGDVKLNNEYITIEFIRNSIGYLFQNPVHFFSGLNPEDELSSIEIKDDLYQRLIDGIELDSSFSKLSSGQQQRIALAAILYSNKTFLILDEPFEFLDSEAADVLSKIIINRNKEGKTIFIIDHISSNFGKNIIAQELRFEKGKLNPDTKSLKAISYPKIQHTIEEEIFAFKNLTFKYKNQTNLLIDLPYFSIKKGEIVGINGKNGCGKTTLFYLLSGLIKPKTGIFYYKNKLIRYNHLLKAIKVSFQNPDFQLFLNSVENEITFSLKNNNFSEKEIGEKLSIAKSFLLFDLNSDPSSLSFGQKKILTIVITYLLNPGVLILDEPFASLDNDNILKVFDLLKEITAKGTSIIISSHNSFLLSAICNRITHLNNK